MRSFLSIALCLTLAAAGLCCPAYAAQPAPEAPIAAAAPAHPATPAPTILFQDSNARASASVAQVLPGSKEPPQLFTHVSKVELQGPVLIIHWAGSATTILPLQFVANVTINQQAATPQPTSSPAAPPPATSRSAQP